MDIRNNKKRWRGGTPKARNPQNGFCADAPCGWCWWQLSKRIAAWEKVGRRTKRRSSRIKKSPKRVCGFWGEHKYSESDLPKTREVEPLATLWKTTSRMEKGNKKKTGGKRNSRGEYRGGSTQVGPTTRKHKKVNYRKKSRQERCHPPAG